MNNAKPWQIAAVVLGAFLVIVLAVLVASEISLARSRAEARDLMDQAGKAFSGSSSLSPDAVRAENRELMKQFPSAGYREDMTIEERNRTATAYMQSEMNRAMQTPTTGAALPGQLNPAPGQTP
jgi:uncharacterized membrane protein YccC